MTRLHMAIFLVATALFSSLPAESQYMQKVFPNAADSTDYYLAIPPVSGKPAGALVILVPYGSPENMLPETRLHNIASANLLLTVYASPTRRRLLPDAATIQWVKTLLSSVSEKYRVSADAFVLGGSDLAGTVVLRYAELSQEHPDQFPVQPKAVFSISGYVDLASLYHRCERQIRKNFFPPTVGDAHFYLDLLNKQIGNPETDPDHYREFSPFHAADTTAGNERWLQHLPIRLYYDTDIDFQLRSRRNSYYETDLPDASELIDRLLLAGNKKAEFISAKQPAFRANGQRSPYAPSIVDETDCIQWIKKELHVFDPATYVAPYSFNAPAGWPIERSALPPNWSPDWSLKGIEEIRFAPGWGKQGAPDYWSMAYLFWLEQGQKLDAEVLQTQLYIYFDGLIKNGGGAGPRAIPQDKMVPTKVSIHQTKTEPGEVATYTGTIDMLNYLALVPMRLNIMAHIKECPGQKHTALFIEASQKPFSDPLWHELEQPQSHFSCSE